MQTDMRADMLTDMRTDMCIGKCTELCTVLCTDMCVDKLLRNVYGGIGRLCRYNSKARELDTLFFLGISDLDVMGNN